jgi:hypothetical protein
MVRRILHYPAPGKFKDDELTVSSQPLPDLSEILKYGKALVQRSVTEIRDSPVSR